MLSYSIHNFACPKRSGSIGPSLATTLLSHVMCALHYSIFLRAGHKYSTRGDMEADRCLLHTTTLLVCSVIRCLRSKIGKGRQFRKGGTRVKITGTENNYPNYSNMLIAHLIVELIWGTC